jgi:hypothetical protein
MPSLQLAPSTPSPDRRRTTPVPSAPWPLPPAHTRSKSSSPTPPSSNGTAPSAIPAPTNPCTSASTASSRHVIHAHPSHRSVHTKNTRPRRPAAHRACVHATDPPSSPDIRRQTSDVFRGKLLWEMHVRGADSLDADEMQSTDRRYRLANPITWATRSLVRARLA